MNRNILSRFWIENMRCIIQFVISGHQLYRHLLLMEDGDFAMLLFLSLSMYTITFGLMLNNRALFCLMLPSLHLLKGMSLMLSNSYIDIKFVMVIFEPRTLLSETTRGLCLLTLKGVYWMQIEWCWLRRKMKLDICCCSLRINVENPETGSESYAVHVNLTHNWTHPMLLRSAL